MEWRSNYKGPFLVRQRIKKEKGVCFSRPELVTQYQRVEDSRVTSDIARKPFLRQFKSPVPQKPCFKKQREKTPSLSVFQRLENHMITIDNALMEASSDESRAKIEGQRKVSKEIFEEVIRKNPYMAICFFK